MNCKKLGYKQNIWYQIIIIIYLMQDWNTTISQSSKSPKRHSLHVSLI